MRMTPSSDISTLPPFATLTRSSPVSTSVEDCGAPGRLRQGVLVGAIYVGPPRSAKDFTRVVQAGADLTSLRADLRRGDLTGLAKLGTD